MQRLERLNRRALLLSICHIIDLALTLELRSWMTEWTPTACCQPMAAARAQSPRTVQIRLERADVAQTSFQKSCRLDFPPYLHTFLFQLCTPSLTALLKWQHSALRCASPQQLSALISDLQKRSHSGWDFSALAGNDAHWAVKLSPCASHGKHLDVCVHCWNAFLHFPYFGSFPHSAYSLSRGTTHLAWEGRWSRTAKGAGDEIHYCGLESQKPDQASDAIQFHMTLLKRSIWNC